MSDAFTDWVKRLTFGEKTLVLGEKPLTDECVRARSTSIVLKCNVESSRSSDAFWRFANTFESSKIITPLKIT